MNRLVLPRVAVLLIFSILVARLYQLQLVADEADRFRYSVGERTTRYLSVRPLRGEVFAADGKTLLAETVPLYAVAVRPADLPDDELRRGEVFAQLSQMLGITATLTISPATALDDRPALRTELSAILGPGALAAAARHTSSPPLSILVPPDRGAAAAELLDRYSPVVQLSAPDIIQPGVGLPADARQSLDAALAQAGATLEVTATLTISPSAAIEQNLALRDDLARLVGPEALASARPAEASWLTVDIPPERTLAALHLARAFSSILTLNDQVAARVARADLPGYETVKIRQSVPREVALVLRENGPSLPGVVVEQDYRRSYNLSDEVPSLSYVLGYVGSINQCELARQNPERSWVGGLLDAIGNSVECGIVRKQINPFQLGMPNYLLEDRIGKDGVEASYEAELRGQLGVQTVVVDALGRPVRAPQVIQPARDGNDLVLTVDVPLQRQTEIILQNWIAESERRRQTMPDTFAYKRDYPPIRSGVAIVMEVKTGRILALVNWPAYDNNLWDPARTAERQALFFPEDPLLREEAARLALQTNRAIAGQYPPGSTLKQFDAVIALERQVITADTKVRDPGRLVVEDQYVAGRFYPYVNASSRDNGFLDVRGALRVSSNIFFMSVAGGNRENVVNLKPEEQNIEKGLGITGLAEGLGWFGFGEPTGVRLVGEAPGRVPTPAWKQQVQRLAWTTGDTYNAAIGQGNLEVTPLQLAAASAAVANDGLLYRPQIVRAVVDGDGNVREVPPELLRRVPAAPEHFATVREGMLQSVTDGVNIAAREQCSGLRIAGKTGTAEFGPVITIPTADGKGTREVRQSHAWFVGFAPYEDPQIQVLVLVEGAGDMNDGSATIAVPAVTQIMQAYFGVTPPDPLPRGCQQGMPPLPARVMPGQPEPPPVLDPRDR